MHLYRVKQDLAFTKTMFVLSFFGLLGSVSGSRLPGWQGEQWVGSRTRHDLERPLRCTVQVRAGNTAPTLSKAGQEEQASASGVQSLDWVFQFDQHTQYTHMAMVEGISNNSIIVAFQAASKQEGGSEQHLQITVSSNRNSRPLHFSPPTRIPVGGSQGAVWGPVLHADEAKDTLWVFYSESRGACKGGVMEWAPGGDIMSVQMQLSTGVWSIPQLVYSLEEDKGIPKVTANKVVVLASGEWVLPFWRERALLGFGPVCRTLQGDGSAGVLISKDSGHTWTAHASLQHPETWLIENTLTQLPSGELVMLFRTEVGHVFISRSQDQGRSWSTAHAIESLPNPDSKVDLMLVRNTADSPLAVVFNDHQHLRTDLRVALSWDGGRSWTRVATLESSGDDGIHLHYPTLIQQGCFLYVVYSRFYGHNTYGVTPQQMQQQGIRIATLDLSRLVQQTSFFDEESLLIEERERELREEENDAFRRKMKLLASGMSGESGSRSQSWWDRHKLRLGNSWKL